MRVCLLQDHDWNCQHVVSIQSGVSVTSLYMLKQLLQAGTGMTLKVCLSPLEVNRG